MIKVNDAKNKSMAFKNDYTDDVINLNVSDDEVNIVDAGYYVAKGTDVAVSLKDYKGESANVDLNNNNFNTKDGLSFRGDIKDVDASGFKGEANIKGNDKANVIKASDGGSTIDGGKGNDTYVGGAGTDEFIIGSGNNSVSNFDAATDKINTGDAAIQTADIIDNNVVFKNDNGRVSIEGAMDKVFQFENQYTDGAIKMQVSDEKVDITEDAYYIATGKDAVAKLGNYKGSADTLVANLGDGNFNNKEGLSFYGDIKELDASGYTKDAQLTGNDKDNVITAGSGNTTLWGGNNGNDTLIGGAGEDKFIYTKGNGRDVIQNAGKNDTIDISGITLDEFINYGDDLFVGNDVKFETKDGGSLTVKDGKTSGSTYTVNGESFVVDGDHWKKIEE
jgi:Ca2+-binding RTX toxin-like protein